MTIADIAPRTIRHWAIVLVCTVSFPTVAGGPVVGQTTKQTISPTPLSIEQNPQTSSAQFLIAQQDSESESAPASTTPTPEADSESESAPASTTPTPEADSESESAPASTTPTPEAEPKRKLPLTNSSSSESDSEPKRKPASTPSSLLTGTNWQMMLPPVLSESENSQMVSESVRLDGRTVFSVAPLSNDRTKAIERNLKTVLRNNFDPNTLKVYYKILNSLPVIYVSSANQPEPIYVLTVTDADAQFQGIEPETLANRWTQQLQQTFRIAYQERQPDALKQQLMRGGILVFVMVFSSLSLCSIRKRLQKKHEEIVAEIPPEPEVHLLDPNSETGEPADNSPEAAEALAAVLQKRVALLQKRNFNEIEQGLIPVGQVGVWGIGTYITVGIFPYTRWLQPVIMSILPIPIQLTLTLISTYVAIRLSRIAINRFFAVLENRNVQLAGTSEQRRTLRFSTFSNVLKNLSSGLMIGVGILVSLSAIGINIAPLLAGAGILGLGISLGSQNLIKDTINGFFVLLEDQYAVGDVIVVGDVGGMVENMNLRITQLRNGEGRLITIPNGAITVVQNLSKEWARVDLTFDISYQSDVEPALALIQEVMDEIYNDVEWREKIIAPPEVLGIDRMDHAGMMIRVWIRVKPLQHWSVGRECRRRLKPRLDAAGISIGIPQQTLMFNNSLELLSLKDGNVDRQDENAEAFTTNRVDRQH